MTRAHYIAAPALALALLFGCGEPAEPTPEPKADGAHKHEGHEHERHGDSGEEAEPRDPMADLEDEIRADLGTEPLAAGDGEQLVTLDVKTMTCHNCGKTVWDALTKVDGVKKARVAWEHGTAWVVVAADRAPEVAQLAAAAKKEGFTVKAKP